MDSLLSFVSIPERRGAAARSAILILALAVGEAVEIDVGAPAVLTLEALPNHVLARPHVIKEWCRSCGDA